MDESMLTIVKISNCLKKESQMNEFILVAFAGTLLIRFRSVIALSSLSFSRLIQYDIISAA